MPDLAWSVGGFVIAIAVLVAFHEFGHYWVARRCGVKVLRFSIGFGRPLWTHRSRDGVEWVIAAVPLGGYVKMLDEREQAVAPGDRLLAFNNATVGRRMAIVAAGPLFNFGLAILLYWAVYVVGIQGYRPVLTQPLAQSAAAQAGLQQMDEVVAVDGDPVQTWTQLRTELIGRALDRGLLHLTVKAPDGQMREAVVDLDSVRVDPEFLFDDLGLNPYQPPIPAVLAQIVAGEAADKAGFQVGDELLSVNDQPIESWQQWADWVKAHPGEVAQVRIKRDGAEQTRTTIIGHLGSEGHVYGRFGASVANPGDLWQDLRAVDRLGVFEAVPEAVAQTWRISSLTLRMLGRMVTGDVSVRNVSGPIQIAQAAGFSAQGGLVSFLSFMAIVSISLGVLNLLPVPVLDGGHLLYYAVEAVKGSPVSERTQEAGQRLGLTLLALLMGLAFYNDIVRLLN
ncbi:RIP metalloprotease RseP [Sinimarinibacterium sp. CAU 1509]|uniref:RIP metalloprotease RseP n=1 Tax=Sinimarinibacterium sp. CAU 1509 TaxID=2562283 RepID=UPI0010AB6426|nr:RIP metalloprotease RseP [Sinimarinibacterium sp. CAU 1509]TJY62088.1 RIP metalloprotease RseP [Sinimarinibacterium sp. CAU 1509]